VYENHGGYPPNNDWLVFYTYPSEKYESQSVGMMEFPIYGNITFMFQTTNQMIK